MLTLETYKQYNGINSPNQDVALTTVINFVNDFIQKYCGISFTKKNKVEHHIAGPVTGGSQVIVPRESPVIQILDVNVGARYLDEDDDYYLDSGLIYLNRILPYHSRVTLDYYYGYEGLPNGLLMPAIELTTYFAKREFNKSQTIGTTGESITFMDPNTVPAHIRAGLDLHRVL